METNYNLLALMTSNVGGSEYISVFQVLQCILNAIPMETDEVSALYDSIARRPLLFQEQVRRLCRMGDEHVSVNTHMMTTTGRSCPHGCGPMTPRSHSPNKLVDASSINKASR